MVRVNWVFSAGRASAEVGNGIGGKCFLLCALVCAEAVAAQGHVIFLGTPLTPNRL